MTECSNLARCDKTASDGTSPKKARQVVGIDDSAELRDISKDLFLELHTMAFPLLCYAEHEYLRINSAIFQVPKFVCHPELLEENTKKYFACMKVLDAWLMEAETERIPGENAEQN
jgi:hypothetical protein